MTYLVGSDNSFSHPSGDQAGRRFALASLPDNGHVKACELERSWGIPHRTLMNWVAPCRASGPSSSFRQATRRKPRIMTADKSAEGARLLGEGQRPAEAARLAGVQESTPRKAIARQGVPKPPTAEADHPTPGRGKNERSRADAQAAAGMGTACTRADERIAAAMGLAAGATTRFEAGHDVALAGRWAGSPALCANGLRWIGSVSQTAAGILQRPTHPPGAGLHGAGKDPPSGRAAAPPARGIWQGHRARPGTGSPPLAGKGRPDGADGQPVWPDEGTRQNPEGKRARNRGLPVGGWPCPGLSRRPGEPAATPCRARALVPAGHHGPLGA